MPSAAESAPKHPEQSAPYPSKYQSLTELTPQNAGIGTWLLQVAEAPREWEYSYAYNGKQCVGKRFEVMMVSPDASVYCMGFFRRKQNGLIGNGTFAEAKQAVRYKTVWEASNIALAKKACFIRSPMKLMIDLNASKMTPVRHSIYKMSSEAAQLDTLHTVLMCPANQRVDVAAMIREMSSTRDASTT